ncbi:MAG TPA: sigma-70 family RNA polymerase sigma factor [Vicinamibacterales bacterium]|nr:sigma-70 family RNA polymerase sigma factor [Vicinamibacterales bacterium]
MTHSSAPARDDAALVAAFRAGRHDAFEEIVRIHGNRLLGVARRIVRDDDLAQEAVQDALVSAFRARDKFAGTSLLSTWLHRITVNAALMKLRSQKRRAEDSIDALLPTFKDDGHHREQFVAWDERADTKLERADTRRMVRAAIDQLPDSYRTVLVMRDIEGLSTEETATALGLTANAVKIRLHRARMALRTLIAPHLQEVSV